MSNVYHVCSGEISFEIVERIINENLKLEMTSEANFMDNLWPSLMTFLPSLWPSWVTSPNVVLPN